MFRIMSWLPLWLRDLILARKLGLPTSQDAAKLLDGHMKSQ